MTRSSPRKRIAHMALLCLAAFALVSVKSVPWIGATFWASTAVDALVLLYLLRVAHRLGVGRTLPAVVVASLADVMLGGVARHLAPFTLIGSALAVWITCMATSHRAIKAVLCALVMSIFVVAGSAIAYVLLKDMTVPVALRSAARGRWYVIAWYAGACALDAFWGARAKARSV